MNRMITFDKNSPKAFILASNSWSDTEPVDDQVWSLVLNPSGQHPFHLATTYGLRARLVQVFPDLLSDNQSLMVGDNYHQPPTVTHYSPGFCRITFILSHGLKVSFSALLTETYALLGNIFLENQGQAALDFQLALVFHLLPLGKGKPAHAEKIGVHHVISAQSGNLSPVLFMTAGPTAGNSSFPGLSLPIKLSPGDFQTAAWALAARHSQAESFAAARRLVTRPWHPIQQHKQMVHARQTLEVQTGNPDWDAAFHLAQVNAHMHFIFHPPDESTPAVVRTRHPDQPALNPQTLLAQDDLTTLELAHLAQVLLPQRADLMALWIRKALNRLQKNGQLLSQRNASPFIKPFLEPPLLAALCLEIFETNRDPAFLRMVYPDLCRITHAWLFTDLEMQNLRPFAWQNPDQCQLSSGLFPFDAWEKTGQGLDFQYAESPALLAMLLREVRSLKKMAEILNDLVSLKRYGSLLRALGTELGAFWNETHQAFLYRDVQSKLTLPSERLLNAKSPDRFTLDRQFSSPQRLVCQLQSKDENTRVCHVTLKGRDDSGADSIEVFKPPDIRWIGGRSHLTTQTLFSELRSIAIEGLRAGDKIILETAGFIHHDITCLAAIWAEDLPDCQLKALLRGPLDSQHPSRRWGLPEVDPLEKDLPKGLEVAVNVLWNTLIIEGLAWRGRSETAKELFTNLMTSITQGLRDYHGFYPHFRVKDGQPLGKPNTIAGLAPLRLCLAIAGIRILTPTQIALWGENPFPWPLKVDWQGLSIRKEGHHTQVTFPDGSTCTHDNTEPVMVAMEGAEP